MKRLWLLAAVLMTLGGCAFMSDEDRDFYGRGWVKPTDLDRPTPVRVDKPNKTPVSPAQGADPGATQNADPAWNVPANDVPPARPY